MEAVDLLSKQSGGDPSFEKNVVNLQEPVRETPSPVSPSSDFDRIEALFEERKALKSQHDKHAFRMLRKPIDALIIEALRRQPQLSQYFEDESKIAQFEQCCSAFHLTRLRKYDRISEQDTICDSFHVILRGQIGVFSNTPLIKGQDRYLYFPPSAMANGAAAVGASSQSQPFQPCAIMQRISSPRKGGGRFKDQDEKQIQLHLRSIASISPKKEQSLVNSNSTNSHKDNNNNNININVENDNESRSRNNHSNKGVSIAVNNNNNINSNKQQQLYSMYHFIELLTEGAQLNSMLIVSGSTHRSSCFCFEADTILLTLSKSDYWRILRETEGPKLQMYVTPLLTSPAINFLPVNPIKELYVKSFVVKFNRDTVVCESNTPATAAFFVLAGEFALWSSTTINSNKSPPNETPYQVTAPKYHNTVPIKMSIIGAGEMFGDIEVLSNSKYMHTLSSESAEGVLLVIPRSIFEHKMSANKAATSPIMESRSSQSQIKRDTLFSTLSHQVDLFRHFRYDAEDTDPEDAETVAPKNLYSMFLKKAKEQEKKLNQQKEQQQLLEEQELLHLKFQQQQIESLIVPAAHHQTMTMPTSRSDNRIQSKNHLLLLPSATLNNNNNNNNSPPPSLSIAGPASPTTLVPQENTIISSPTINSFEYSPTAINCKSLLPSDRAATAAVIPRTAIAPTTSAAVAATVTGGATTTLYLSTDYPSQKQQTNSRKLQNTLRIRTATDDSTIVSGQENISIPTSSPMSINPPAAQKDTVFAKTEGSFRVRNSKMGQIEGCSSSAIYYSSYGYQSQNVNLYNEQPPQQQEQYLAATTTTQQQQQQLQEQFQVSSTTSSAIWSKHSSPNPKVNIQSSKFNKYKHDASITGGYSRAHSARTNISTNSNCSVRSNRIFPYSSSSSNSQQQQQQQQHFYVGSSSSKHHAIQVNRENERISSSPNTITSLQEIPMRTLTTIDNNNNNYIGGYGVVNDQYVIQQNQSTLPATPILRLVDLFYGKQFDMQTTTTTTTNSATGTARNSSCSNGAVGGELVPRMTRRIKSNKKIAATPFSSLPECVQSAQESSSLTSADHHQPSSPLRQQSIQVFSQSQQQQQQQPLIEERKGTVRDPMNGGSVRLECLTYLDGFNSNRVSRAVFEDLMKNLSVRIRRDDAEYKKLPKRLSSKEQKTIMRHLKESNVTEPFQIKLDEKIRDKLLGCNRKINYISSSLTSRNGGSKPTSNSSNETIPAVATSIIISDKTLKQSPSHNSNNVSSSDAQSKHNGQTFPSKEVQALLRSLNYKPNRFQIVQERGATIPNQSPNSSKLENSPRTLAAATGLAARDNLANTTGASLQMQSINESATTATTPKRGGSSYKPEFRNGSQPGIFTVSKKRQIVQLQLQQQQQQLSQQSQQMAISAANGNSGITSHSAAAAITTTITTTTSRNIRTSGRSRGNQDSNLTLLGVYSQPAGDTTGSIVSHGSLKYACQTGMLDVRRRSQTAQNSGTAVAVAAAATTGTATTQQYLQLGSTTFLGEQGFTDQPEGLLLVGEKNSGNSSTVEISNFCKHVIGVQKKGGQSSSSNNNSNSRSIINGNSNHPRAQHSQSAPRRRQHSFHSPKNVAGGLGGAQSFVDGLVQPFQIEGSATGERKNITPLAATAVDRSSGRNSSLSCNKEREIVTTEVHRSKRLTATISSAALTPIGSQGSTKNVFGQERMQSISITGSKFGEQNYGKEFQEGSREQQRSQISQ